MVVLADWGFHRAAGAPANVMICRRGQWNVRMKVETVFSMLSVIGMYIAGYDEGIVNPAAGGRAGIGFWAPLRTQRQQHAARRRTVHTPSKEIVGATLRRYRIVACTPRPC